MSPNFYGKPTQRALELIKLLRAWRSPTELSELLGVQTYWVHRLIRRIKDEYGDSLMREVRVQKGVKGWGVYYKIKK